MYIVEGIAYAGEQSPVLKIVGVRPMDDYQLWLKFSNGEERIFDFSSKLDEPAFTLLKDVNLFEQVYIEYGVPVWNNGDIDIAPEYLYENSKPAK